MFLIRFLRLTLALVVIAGALEADAQPRCARPWVFFDLGQTLVDTDSFNFKPMFYMPGAQEYLSSLEERGHPIGLITDIPEEWGRDIPSVAAIRDETTSKWVRTLLFTQGRVAQDDVAWRGAPFDWRPFGRFVGRGSQLKFVGRVVLPMSNLERKDTGNPILFERARKMAASAGCPALFMTEDDSQFPAVRRAGLFPYQVGSSAAENFFLSPEKIAPYIEEQRRRPNPTVIFNKPSSAPTRAQRPHRPRRFPL